MVKLKWNYKICKSKNREILQQTWIEKIGSGKMIKIK